MIKKSSDNTAKTIMGNPHPKLENLKPFTGADDPRRGRKPKGAKHINTYIQELLADPEFTAKIRIGYEIKEFKGAPVKAIIQAQMIKAIEGDTKAFDSLAKYGWNPRQEIDLTSNGETIGATDPVLAANFAEYIKKQQ